MRRAFGALAVLLVLVLSGCSSSPEPPRPTLSAPRVTLSQDEAVRHVFARRIAPYTLDDAQIDSIRTLIQDDVNPRLGHGVAFESLEATLYSASPLKAADRAARRTIMDAAINLWGSEALKTAFIERVIADLSATHAAEAAAKKAQQENQKWALRRALDGATVPSARKFSRILKHPSAFEGKTYKIYAKVWQFDAATGDAVFIGDAAGCDTRINGTFVGARSVFIGSTEVLHGIKEHDVVRLTVRVDRASAYLGHSVPRFTVLRIARTGGRRS